MRRRSLLNAFALGLPLVLIGGRSAQALGGPLPPLDEPAPPFSLPQDGGAKQVSLADFRGQWVVLYFYPKDGTPGCTLEAQRFQQDLAQYRDRNAVVVGVSADAPELHAEFRTAEGLKYPLLSDSDGTVSKAYGSWLAPYSLRHTFLIDPQGVLRERFVAVRPVVHSREVLARLDELQTS